MSVVLEHWAFPQIGVIKVVLLKPFLRSGTLVKDYISVHIVSSE